MNLLKDLDDLVARLEEQTGGSAWKALKDPIDRLEKSCEYFAKSFCNSVFGYHGNIYYENFEPPPPGARFSSLWGFEDRFGNATVGDWVEYAPDDIRAAVLARAKVQDMRAMVQKASPARDKYEESRVTLQSILSRLISLHPGDNFLATMPARVEKLVIPTAHQAEQIMRASFPNITYDQVAAGGGIVIPPHIRVYAETLAMKGPFKQASELAALARGTADHLRRGTNPAPSTTAAEREAVAAIAGPQIIINAPVFGGVQVGSPGAVQQNISQVVEVESAVQSLSRLIGDSGLGELEREEAVIALIRVGDLAKRPKRPDVLKVVGEKLETVRKIVGNTGALATAAAPYLKIIWDWTQSFQ